MLHLSKKIQC